MSCSMEDCNASDPSPLNEVAVALLQLNQSSRDVGHTDDQFKRSANTPVPYSRSVTIEEVEDIDCK
jgi:hypothetical protein